MVGHKITAAYYATSAGGVVSAASQNVLKKEATRWRKPGDITDIPVYSSGGEYSSLNSEWYDLKLESGDFLKCTSISFGYRVPSKICQKFSLTSILMFGMCLPYPVILAWTRRILGDLVILIPKSI